MVLFEVFQRTSVALASQSLRISSAGVCGALRNATLIPVRVCGLHTVTVQISVQAQYIVLGAHNRWLKPVEAQQLFNLGSA